MNNFKKYLKVLFYVCSISTFIFMILNIFSMHNIMYCSKENCLWCKFVFFYVIEHDFSPIMLFNVSYIGLYVMCHVFYVVYMLYRERKANVL